MKKEIIILWSMLFMACSGNNNQNSTAMDEADKLWKEQTDVFLQAREVGSLMNDAAVHQNLTQVDELSRE